MRLTTITLFCAALALAGCGPPAADTTPMRMVPPFTASQSSNALDRVGSLIAAATPRDAGTEGAERAAKWIKATLSRHGLATHIDTFTDTTPRGERSFHNVLATIPGNGKGWVLLLSHFDTKCGIGAGFEGANDSGSSTGLLMELAVALQAAAPLRHTFLCAFLDGEECMDDYAEHDGFHGSKRLARQMRRADRKILAVILMDMVGDKDLKLTLPYNSTGSLRLLALEAAEATNDRAHIGVIDSIIYDDHQAFLDLGYPAVNLIDFEYGSAPGKNDYWHTPEDTMEKISAESLAITGRIVVEMVNRLLRSER